MENKLVPRIDCIRRGIRLKKTGKRMVFETWFPVNAAALNVMRLPKTRRVLMMRSGEAPGLLRRELSLTGRMAMSVARSLTSKVSPNC